MSTESSGSEHEKTVSPHTQTLIATRLDLYRNSCAAKAAEVWRMWNEFPEHRESPEFVDVLRHFGDNVSDVLNDISLVMSHLMSSTTRMCFDDSFVLRYLFSGDGTSSSFLRICIASSLTHKFGDSGMRYSACGAALLSARSPYCSYCNSLKPMLDLAAYVARMRLNSP